MAKNDEVAIERLVLEVGGKKVELTIEQAKRLFGALDELFGKKEVEEHHYHDWGWRWPYPRPIWTATNGLQAQYRASDSTLSCKV